MKMKQLSCALLLCLGLTGCQAVTDTLSTVNSALGSVNSALYGVTRSTVSNETQISSDNAVKNAKAENSAKILYNQAKPAISKYVALIACSSDTSQLTAYSDPDSMEPNGLGMPQHEMYHHKSGCLKILRIEKIKKLAANTVSFQTVYMSPQSEEVVRKTHFAVKQPSGEWLFNFWGI